MNNVHRYIEKHELYEEDNFCRLYEAFLYGGIRSGVKRRITDAWTLDIECQGQLLVARDKVGDPDELIPFIENILTWGGPTGDLVRIGYLYRSQDNPRIAEVVNDASRDLLNGELESAIATIVKNIKGLEVSYASKILRMLSPQKAGAYDKYLRESLGYSQKKAERFAVYEKFCVHCGEVIPTLQERGIENPFRVDGEWYVADVEATVYRHVDDDRRKTMERARREKKASP